LSVTSALGAKPCFLSSLRISFHGCPPSLRQEIENFAFVIDRAPEPEFRWRSFA
jgi:hypothetical protein